jgi:hypothetical protein
MLLVAHERRNGSIKRSTVDSLQTRLRKSGKEVIIHKGEVGHLKG